MAPNPHKKKSSAALKVWVLAPHLITDDANLDYYYDFTQSIAEYTKVFAELGLQWHWQPVTMSDYKAVIDEILAEKKSKKYFLNHC